MDESIREEIEEANKKLENADAKEVLRWAIDRFSPKIGIASSFGAEDVVLMDLALKVRPDVKVFTLDTGRLHEDTYSVMEEVRKKYGKELVVYSPDTKALQELSEQKGFFSFKESVDNRRECCIIRKVEPLRRALSVLDAWVTGLRRNQSTTRVGLPKVEWDEGNGLFKLNPLADWSEEEIWAYIKENDIPYNKLHDKGFPSIGCEPCTRAIEPGENVRAGRWWWESPDTKECGLHPGRKH